MTPNKAIQILKMTRDPFFTQSELTTAYRKRVKETHPDLWNNNGEEFKLVQEAYLLLRQSDNNHSPGQTDLVVNDLLLRLKLEQEDLNLEIKLNILFDNNF